MKPPRRGCSMEGRMTQGSIAGRLVRFAIPLIFSALLQQMYSWADALVVGNFAGELALAAIGATGAINGMTISVITGFSVGISILVAQAYGRGEESLVTRTASTFLQFLVVVGTVLAALGAVLTSPLLSLLGTPEAIHADARLYLIILFIGQPFLAAYNLYSAALRGIGDSRTPFVAIVVSSLGNVALDLLFVAAFGWGVAGAAAATVLSQVLMVAYLAIYVPRRHALMRFSLGRAGFDKTALREGLRLGIPTAVQASVLSIGRLMLQNIMNGFGAQVIAAITTAYRIDTLGLLPTTNIGEAVATFTGQNHGAGESVRAKRGLRVGTVMAFCTSLVTTAIFVLAGAPLMRMFGVTEGAVAIGREFLYTCAVFYPVFGLEHAFIGYLTGRGDVRFTAFASISSLAVRILLSYLLMDVAGYRVIAYSEMASWVYGFLLCFIRYMVKYRRETVTF